MTIQMIINEIQTHENQTVLETATAHNIVIPTLCHHKDLSPVGSCRLCIVEVDNMRGQIAACNLLVAEGMVVRTETPMLVQSRRVVLSLLLQNYDDNDYGLQDEYPNEFEHWVNFYHAKPLEGLSRNPRYCIDQDTNPFIHVNFNKCVLCTRCVRACGEIQGRFVWGVGERGSDTRIIAGSDTTLLEAGCESCGACIAYCPTGALNHKLSIGQGVADRKVTTTCPYCGVGCQFDLNVKDERVIRVTSNPNSPINGMHLCVKGRFGYDFIHHPDRLTVPRVRRYLLNDGRKVLHGSAWDWVETSWDTALDISARKLAKTRDRYGGGSVGVLTSAKCLNEENYLMNKLARQVLGTHNIDHCARL
jgi:predicted molibdopterin-dependent oxidoreductase YjgC